MDINVVLPLRALVTVICVAALLAGCGSGGESRAQFQRVQDTGATLSPQSLFAAGFKESKSYEVDGLPGAKAAIFGFWRPAGEDPLDYEVRIYDSHSEAVNLGTVPAEEGTGADAVLDESAASFKPGVRDRRTIIGSGAGGGARSGIGPKYADFVIYNNLLILCPGGQPEQAHERCADLIAALESVNP